MIAEAFVKSLPVMDVSVRHKPGRPPYVVCVQPPPPYPSTTPLKSN